MPNIPQLSLNSWGMCLLYAVLNRNFPQRTELLSASRMLHASTEPLNKKRNCPNSSSSETCGKREIYVSSA